MARQGIAYAPPIFWRSACHRCRTNRRPDRECRRRLPLVTGPSRGREHLEPSGLCSRETAASRRAGQCGRSASKESIRDSAALECSRLKNHSGGATASRTHALSTRTAARRSTGRSPPALKPPTPRSIGYPPQAPANPASAATTPSAHAGQFAAAGHRKRPQ